MLFLVALPFGAIDASLNLLFFETLGGTDSFEIVPQSYNLNDLIDGKVQLVSAYLTNEPYQLRKRGIEFNILHPRSYGIDYFGDNLFTSETEVRNNPERVQKMISATLKGWDLLNDGLKCFFILSGVDLHQP